MLRPAIAIGLWLVAGVAAAGAINTTRSNIKNSFRIVPGQSPVIVTPVEIRFEDRSGYDDFIAGRLPVSLTLRNTASGQTIRFDPLILERRPASSAGAVRLDVMITDVDPRLLAGGCFETATEAQPRAGGGMAVAIDYQLCRPDPAGATARASNPIEGITVTVRKKPPTGESRLVVTTSPSEVGAGAEARISARYGGAQFGGVTLLSGKGVASPRRRGF